jgi:hypothetical protein
MEMGNSVVVRFGFWQSGVSYLTGDIHKLTLIHIVDTRLPPKNPNKIAHLQQGPRSLNTPRFQRLFLGK